MSADTRASEALVRRGFRLTGQRAAVLGAVAGIQGAFSADELWLAARAASAGLGIATVYRTLELLVRMGVVVRVHGGESCETYVAAGKEHGHTVVCRQCGAASELSDLGCQDLITEVARRTGFRIEEHVIQLRGLCARCGKDGP